MLFIWNWLKTMLWERFWTQLKTVLVQNPCCVRPCYTRPYCTLNHGSCSWNGRAVHEVKRLEKSHRATIHKGKDIFKCEICHEKFSESCDLSSHIAMIHEGKETHSINCEVCDEYFSESFYLNIKETSHANVIFL